MTKLELVDVPIYRGNWRIGRAGQYPIDRIVVHVMEGDMEGTRSWFNNPTSEVSAHYGISLDGEIVRYVEETDTAFHAGILDHPTARVVTARLPLTPNSYAIGIEHEGMGTAEMPDAQRAASYALIRDICERRKIPIDREHIIGHHEVRSAKSCPGKINVDRIVRELGAIPEPMPSPEQHPPRVVWSEYLKDYLVVTDYISDEHWRFAKLGDIRRGKVPTYPAETPLSKMPLNAR